jgi:predicted ATPase
MSLWEPPIRSVELPGITVGLKGLIVLVGPNSSGKTNLLRDIYAAASGLERQLVVANQIQFRSVPPVDEYLDFFKSSGDIEQIQPGTETYIKKGHQYGSLGGGQSGPMQKKDIEAEHRTFIQ